jgi:hypothetical protein
MRPRKHSAFNDLVSIFERHIERTVLAARELHWLLVSVDGDTSGSERRIRELRRAAEAITELAVTAMECQHGPWALRDQPLAFIRHLQTLLACIERAAERMGAIGAPPPHVFELAQALVRVTEELKALLTSLHHPERARERSFACSRVHELTREMHLVGTAARRDLLKQHEQVLTSMMQALAECEAIAALVEKEERGARTSV